jgi:hypothetical protein
VKLDFYVSVIAMRTIAAPLVIRANALMALIARVYKGEVISVRGRVADQLPLLVTLVKKRAVGVQKVCFV